MPWTGLVQRVAALEQRNKRVDADKGWETSVLRRYLIAGFTYISVVAYGFAADVPNPALNAIVPTLGFLHTIPAVKQWWIQRKFDG